MRARHVLWPIAIGVPLVLGWSYYDQPSGPIGAEQPRAHEPPRSAAAAPAPAPTGAPAGAASGAPKLTVSDPASIEVLPPELVDDGSDDLPSLEPEPPEADPAPGPAKTRHELASTARETWVFAEPKWSSRRIGYLRAGAIVERRGKPAGWTSCPEGWYRIEPHGYVCAGTTATLDTTAPVVVASSKRASFEGLPYTYVMGRFPPPPLYVRLPTSAQQEKIEPDLIAQLRRAKNLEKTPGFVAPPPADPTPAFLQSGTVLPALGGAGRSESAVSLGRSRIRSGFALLGTYDHEGRRFGLTTDMQLIPIDRTRVVQESAFHGITLEKGAGLPVVFVKKKHARTYTMDDRGAVKGGDGADFRAAFRIEERTRRAGNQTYVATIDGPLLRPDDVVRVEKLKKAPAWAVQGRKWIDVSILRQTLVAYEGTEPVYATLVSTGADGLGDPKKTRSTVQGAFLIHTKHVTVTMDGDQVGDEFDFRDVPFVQYFTEGFALHAAYWHDEFGKPRSHGCINLAPKDAAWLFRWTDPPVPEGWHAALSLKRGTLVHIHP